MKIGFSLPIDYLAGVLSEASELWTMMYGSVQECLTELKNYGVTSIEINGMTDMTTHDKIKRGISVVMQAGLHTTVHGWLPEFTVNQQLSIVVEEANENLIGHTCGKKIPFTVHGHKAGSTASVVQVTQQTIADLKTLASTFKNENYVFIPALEISRAKIGGSLGVKYNEVYEIASEVGFDSLGLCWDVGHSQVNYLVYGYSAFPHEDFAKKVIHTHIHDIGVGGRTHGPVLNETGYINESISILKNVGYRGVYNLELYPLRWAESPANCRRDLLKSIDVLVNMVLK